MPAAQIYALSRAVSVLSDALAIEVERACIDTLAVMCAGWDEPVTRAVRQAYGNVPAPWHEAVILDPESTALVWATAAHALDYDDVHMTSVTHPSTVMVPAIEAAARFYPEHSSRMAGAYAVGLAVNVALGKAMGFAHYAQGWHATSTIGAVAAGAAVAHLLDVDERGFHSALAIAAAQAGGLQRNFGSMVKPLQAGLAAQAGVRAARLALAGVVGPQDVLSGSNGFMAVFGGGSQTELLPPLELDVEEALAGLSRKLFACCYLAHRPISAAIALHGRGARRLLDDADTRVEVIVPPGCLKALIVDIPSTGAEAKFSGQYTVARALLQGEVGLAAFRDENIMDSNVMGIARRVVLRESAPLATDDVGIDRGFVTVSIMKAGVSLAEATTQHYPGSPSAPMTDAQLLTKLRDCAIVGVPDRTDVADQLRNLAARFAGRSA